jgi:sodium/bile acid cotransporter 7
MRLPSIGILLSFLFLGHLSAFTTAHTVNRPKFLLDQRLKGPNGPNEHSPVLRRQWRRDQADFPVSHGNSKLRSAIEGDALSEANPGALENFKTFAGKNSFLLGMFVAVGFARAFPALGKNGGVLRPELFIGRFGVTLIFLLSGLSLELTELAQAASNFKLNTMVQLITFGAWPFLVGLPLTRAFATFLPNVFPKPLLDGVLILTCLPTTVNMCIFLTSASGGNVASSLCNAVVSNLFGIFLTPALLFRFFGAQIQLPFLNMVAKLCSKVLLPVAVGQALRGTKVKDMYKANAKRFKRLQELILLSIVWNAFCNTFSQGLGLELRHGLGLLVLLPTLHLLSLGILFKLFSQPFWNLSRGEVVAAIFCASHKTLAFGLPLVGTIFEGNPNLASYCAPIMFIHPLQLIIGSILVPRLMMYTESEDSSNG